MSPHQPHRLSDKVLREEKTKRNRLLLVFSRSWTGEWTGCDACESILNQYFPHEEKKEKKKKRLAGWQ